MIYIIIAITMNMSLSFALYRHFKTEIECLKTDITQLRCDNANTHQYLMVHIKGEDKE